MMAIPTDSIARAIVHAIEQPPEVEIDEVVIRPTAAIRSPVVRRAERD
jgi:NADP-dependent 3-hydroxy acid dehydrogenase YdfG